MKFKHKILNKFDHMKVHSANFILAERTNCELEHVKNIGKIDPQFYGISLNHPFEDNERPIIKNQSIDLASSLHHENGRVHKEDHPAKHVSFSKIDCSGSSPKKYVSTCYLKPVSAPTWFSEYLLIHIGSTKRRFEEKVYFKSKLHPYYWSENMTTEVNQIEAPIPEFCSSSVIQIEDPGEHYISLEPQQEIIKKVISLRA